MIYDATGQRTLMFGGSDFNQAYNDLWAYDHIANAWSKEPTTNAPQPRQMHGLVYVADQGALVLFGGRRVGGGAAFEDTWKLDLESNVWEELITENRPPVSDHVNLVYNDSRNELFLFSGPDAYVLGGGQVRPQSTWAYDFETNEWTNLNPTNSPDGDHNSLVYDPLHEKIILFGNSQNSDDMFTWKFDHLENDWINITPQSFPSINYISFDVIEHAGMVYIDHHNVFIQYGGCCSSATLELVLDK